MRLDFGDLEQALLAKLRVRVVRPEPLHENGVGLHAENNTESKRAERHERY